MSGFRESWRRLPWWVALLLVALAVWLRHRHELLPGDMPQPDFPFIMPYLREAGWAEVWGWFTGDWVQHNFYYRPLVSLSFWIDYRLFGEQALYWRWHNLLLLIVVSLLLTQFVREAADSRLGGLLAGLYSSGGQVSESIVRHVSPRTDALCAVFFTASLWMAWRWARQGGRRRAGWSLALMALALMAKEMAVSLVVLVPLAAWAAGAGRRGLAKLVFAAVAVTGGYWLGRSLALDQSPFRPVIVTAARRRWSLRIPPLLGVLYPPYQDRIFLLDFSPAQLLLPRDAWRLVLDLGHTGALPLLAWRAPRLLVFGFLWKLISYLPVLPFRLTLVHYYYIPQLGDGFLLGCAAAVVLRWWQEREGRGG